VRLKSVFTEEAQSDIREASSWYEKQSIGLGKQFIKSVRKAIRSIQNTPFGFVSRFGDFRAIPLNKFPYLLYYQIDEKQNLIVVFAVLHTHNNPFILQNRVRKE
jgi:plasmid stabilization system protein ParE